MVQVCCAAYPAPCRYTAMPSVASATEGAAPNRPAKLLGRRMSPSIANADTTTRPPGSGRRIRSSSFFPKFRQRPAGPVDGILARQCDLRDGLEGAGMVLHGGALVVDTGRWVGADDEEAVLCRDALVARA